MSSVEIRRLYRVLSRAYGPLHWWPARTRFEVIVGAFLTQNTSWKNVEKALRNLRNAQILSVGSIRETAIADLEQLIRPSGYFRQKALRLKTFVAYLDEHHGGSLKRMFSQPLHILRPELLNLNGVGPETADAILLYAGKLPVFVVDAYTKRILVRHGMVHAHPQYEELRSQVEDAFLPATPAELVDHFNEFHALIVEVGKRHCGTVAKCQGCPLESLLPASVALRKLQAGT
jgi:endonuclease-3 related protein